MCPPCPREAKLWMHLVYSLSMPREWKVLTALFMELRDS